MIIKLCRLEGFAFEKLALEIREARNDVKNGKIYTQKQIFKQFDLEYLAKD